ncbi:hypothetical protein [Pedobacter frigoris]|uniref:Transmembrane protein n=1 Tax=Pedobacter frigoris TaxID=2571272 RepID=A0A4U1CHU7_9SPHI|nr:hypothetical protein [Pedobacter frigoris]TKC06933.1 hypothetical protein FA047_06590 [Pedobacter frigoris]
MKFTLSVILLLMGHLASAQTGYKQKVTDYSSVVFPGQPVHIDTLGQNCYKYVDSLAVYLVAIREGKEEDDVLDAAKLSEYYEGVIKGILRVTNGKLISKKAFDTQGLKGIDFVYTSTQNPNVPYLRFQRIIFINNALIAIHFFTFSENKAAAEIASNKFFNSFVINASGTELSQGVDHPSAVKLASLLAKLITWTLTYGVLIGGGAIIVFIVRKFTVRSK